MSSLHGPWYPDPPKDRCGARSPIVKFDEGPARCRKERGHDGLHVCRESDARHVSDVRCDYERRWDDEGRFHS